jgi:NADH-quinone oxidoreductase subunit L
VCLATVLWKGGDQSVIDGFVVNGSWKLVGMVSRWSRRLQTGSLYHYALVMILGMFGLITWFVWDEPLK